MSDEIMRKNIERAQEEINLKKELVEKGSMRQKYHFMAPTGWINDPNGLIYFKGKYHFFYQYNPYYGHWDYMHWGHAVSEDMLHWEHLPLALAPSEPYDDHYRGGCFSGSAIEHDGKLYLIYTSVANHGKGFEQTQSVAYSDDGIHFEKYDGNPVLTAPEGVNKEFFRDPKVWKHEGTFYMVCGANCGGKAQALLYTSKDLLHWNFFNVLAESYGEWGYMWECPDFFRLGDQYVLTCSPMGAGLRTNVYFVGDFDYETGKFVSHTNGQIDWGLDYYAPQSFLAPDGRRIMVAWSNEWEWMDYFQDWGPTYEEGWCGFFNLLREVRMQDDGTLRFLPVSELMELRNSCEKREEFVVGEREVELCAGDGVCYELKFEIDLKKTNASQLILSLRCNEERKLICQLDFQKAQMVVDRNQADGWGKGISKNSLYLKGKQNLDIHIFSDQSSVEIFTDNYQNNHSMNVFASGAQNQIKICAHGGSAWIRNMEAYGIEKC